jgi:hypothetical protein
MTICNVKIARQRLTTLGRLEGVKSLVDMLNLCNGAASLRYNLAAVPDNQLRIAQQGAVAPLDIFCGQDRAGARAQQVSVHESE